MKMLATVLAAGFALVLLAFVALVVAGKLRSRGGWAIVDRDGDPVGDARYEAAEGFSGGLAAVRVDGRWGYVDREGRIAIAPRFTRAGPFEGAYAVAEEGVGVGVIDRAGAWVLPPEYRAVPGVAGDVAVVLAVVGARARGTGPELSAGLVRLDGGVIVAPEPAGDPDRWHEARDLSEGRVAVRRDDGWHLSDLERTIVFVGADALRGPHDGLAAAKRGDAWGYVDPGGREAIAPAWRDAGDFSEGRAPVEGDDGWHVIDARGEVVGAEVFAQLRPYSEGLAPAQAADGRWGFVGKDGAWAIAAQWPRVGEEGFRSGRARVARAAGLDYEWAWIEPDGRVVGDRWYADVLPYEGERALARR